MTLSHISKARARWQRHEETQRQRPLSINEANQLWTASPDFQWIKDSVQLLMEQAQVARPRPAKSPA